MWGPHQIGWGRLFCAEYCGTRHYGMTGEVIVMEPTDMPIGRFAGLIDPQGASFTVMQPASSA